MSTSTILGIVLTGGVAGVLWKVTALLVVAVCLAFALSRASAAIRHLVWLTALAGSIALVFVAPIAPRVSVPLAEAVLELPTETVIGVTTPRMGFERASYGTLTEARLGRARALVVERESLGRWLAKRAPFIIVSTWLIGLFVVIGRCGLGHLAVARLVNRSREPSSPMWDTAVANALVGADVDRDVRVLISDDLAAPVTSGFIRPVVLLPRDADEWSDERRQVVLVHELAHIARLDYLAQLVATCACALYWFHPLAWFAAARLRTEAEHAADDRVLAAGTPGVAYAAHLLELARVESTLHLSASVAVGMVRASRLEERFRAMLDDTRSRAAVSRRVQATATTIALAAMIPVSGLRATYAAYVESPVIRMVETAPVVAVTEAQATVLIQQVVDSLIERTIDAVSGDRLMLDLETGGSVTIRGWDESRIRVRARLGGDDWRDTRVTLERVGSGARLRSTFDGTRDNRSTRHRFELWVPRRTSVELASSGGSLAINDLTGDFRGHTGGGAITIENANGSATISTGGGDVRVTNSALDGRVSTGGGEVLISNVTGGLTGSSGSGPVITGPSGITRVGGFGAGGSASTRATTTTVIGGVEGGGYGRGGGTGIGGTVSSGGGSGFGGSTSTTITSSGITTNITSMTTDRSLNGMPGYTYTKAGGNIELDEAPNGARLRTGGGRIYIGSSSGFLGVSTGGGDIDLPRVTGDVSAWTGAGDVTITVVNTDGTEHSVDVFSGKGRVVLDLPSSIDARFELETAYTETQPRTMIESDFSLTQSETSRWDDSQGTPRRFVRARGTMGSGRGLIRVRVVNGDIIVRRSR